MFDNPILKAMATKAVKNHFESTGTKAIVIKQKEDGDFSFESYANDVTIVDTLALKKILEKVELTELIEIKKEVHGTEKASK